MFNFVIVYICADSVVYKLNKFSLTMSLSKKKHKNRMEDI